MQQEKTNIYQLRFLVVDRTIFKDKRLSELQKFVCSFIYSYTGKFFFSNKKIAEMFDANPKYISNVIKRLEEYGYIKLRYKKTPRGTTKRYIIRKLGLFGGYPAGAGGGYPAGAEHKDNNKNNIYISKIWNFYLLKAKTKEKLLPGRKKKIAARLKQYSPDQIQQAIKNCFKSPFHTGENDRGWVANADYIFRSDENIDKLLNLKIKDTRTIEERQWDQLMGNE